MALTSLTLVLTRRCNLRCRYCSLQRTPARTVAWPLLRSALDVLLAEGSGDLDVMFTGGEPLLALPVLTRTVQHLEQTQSGRRIAWEVVTNGLLLGDEAVDVLDAHGFVVNLSFDGVPAAQAERCPGSFETLDRLLAHLKVSRPSLFERLVIAMTVSPPTVPYLAASAEYFLSTGARTVTMAASVPAGGWEPGRMAELDEQFDRLTASARVHYERTGLVPLTIFRKEDSAQPAPRRDWICRGAAPDAIAIDVDGHAFGCSAASGSCQAHTAPVLGEAVAALSLGPVGVPGFGERLASMPARASACGAYTHPERRYSGYRRCADCEYLGRCYACPLSGAADPGWPDVDRVPDFVCAWNQVSLAHRDRFPCQPVHARA